MNHTDILNQIIFRFQYTSYLEIGVGTGDSFMAIQLDDAQKTGVDPNPIAGNAILPMSSDAFFASNRRTFDLIFIDGLHHHDQVYRDILHALAVLNPNGTIVCHDINPTTYEEQAIPPQQIAWTGDCWKAWVRLRGERPDLDMKVVDTDFGCGIIRTGTQSILAHFPLLDWNEFVIHRREWLNLISISEFNQLYPMHACNKAIKFQPIKTLTLFQQDAILNHTRILNYLAAFREYHSYLEIGLENFKENYDRICCQNKVGLDVASSSSSQSPGVRHQTSDDYFRENNQSFDLIFIDGDHDEAQVARDIENALAVLKPGGTIVLHDALPPNEELTHQERKALKIAWTGTVWKAVLRYFATSDYFCYIVDCDWGLAVIDSATPRNIATLLVSAGDLVYSQHFRLLDPFRISPQRFIERIAVEYRRKDEDLIIKTNAPSVGLVIGSYGAPAYIHLQLEAWKRFYPTIPLLVHDDLSSASDQIADLCQIYGASYYKTKQREGHQEGDLSACIKGLEFGRDRELDIMVKFSRTWLPLDNFVPCLQQLAYESQYATYSHFCNACGFGFRSECVGWHVPTYVEGGYLDKMKEALPHGHEAWGYVERFLHQIAKDVVDHSACLANDIYRASEPSRREDRCHYGLWDWMGDNCHKRNERQIWHTCDTPLDYYRASVLYRLSYSLEAFEYPPRLDRS
jgi:predicted O-methyltransferase YrrM